MKNRRLDDDIINDFLVYGNEENAMPFPNSTSLIIVIISKIITMKRGEESAKPATPTLACAH